MRIVKERIKLLVFILFLSLASTIVGISLLSKQNNYIKTSGVITRINVIENGVDESNDYEVYVDYEIDGKKYNNLLGYYQNGYVEGKQIDIMYDPSDYNNITTASKGFAIYLVIIGPVILVIGILLMLRR